MVPAGASMPSSDAEDDYHARNIERLHREQALNVLTMLCPLTGRKQTVDELGTEELAIITAKTSEKFNCEKGHHAARYRNDDLVRSDLHGRCVDCVREEIAEKQEAQRIADGEREVSRMEKHRRALERRFPEWSHLPMTRDKAKEWGADFYFPGETCRNRHIAPRTTKGNQCLHCIEDKREALANDPEYQEMQRAAHHAKRERDIKAGRERVPWSRKDIRKLYAQQNNKCKHCGVTEKAVKLDAEHAHNKGLITRNQARARAKFHVDHIEPLSIGGTNDPSNLQLLCYKCNTTKNNKREVSAIRVIGHQVKYLGPILYRDERELAQGLKQLERPF
jgi:hypothetical protein